MKSNSNTMNKQIEAVKRARMPEIRLDEKVLDGIKGLSLDEAVTITLEARVIEVGREADYDFDLPMKEGEVRPKVLKACFAVKKATLKK